MSRSKLGLLSLFLALTVSSALAQSDSLISEGMIQAETVNYSNTVAVEKGVYERTFSAQATEYYPYTYELRFEGDDARFEQFLVKRNSEVKAGDVLATFVLDIDEVGLASRKQALKRAQEAFETQKLQRQETIQEQLEQLALVQDPFEHEILALTIQRAQISLEQYCIEQERQISAMQQEIAEIEEKHSQTALIAPFDGVVTSVNYFQTGERLERNEVLLTLYRTDGMLLRITNDSNHFRYGMEVEVLVGPAKSRTTLSGRIVGADNMLPDSQHSGYAYIQLDSYEEYSSRMVPPTVSATSYYMEDVLLLPRRAVVLDGGKYYVNKLSDGTLEKRYVNVAMQNANQAWILQGLEEGETIIID